MVFALYNRIKQTCSGSGTGDIDILSGSASVGHKKISQEYAIGDTGIFVVESGDDYEIIIGTVASSDTVTIDTLERTTVIESTNGGAKLSLDALETHTVSVVVPEQKFPYLNQNDLFGVQLIRNAIMEAIQVNTTADRPSSPKDYQVIVKLGGSSVGDGNGGIEYWDGAAWQSLDLTNSLTVDDSTIENNSGTLRIKDSGVTLAKIQNFSQDRIAGRISAGAGVLEQLTAANLKTILDYQGDEIDYDNATSSLTATNVQDAIDEIEDEIDSVQSDITDIQNVVSTQQSAIGSLTDSTSGTTDDTLEDVSTSVGAAAGGSDPAASQSDVNDRLTAINNNFAELNTKVDAILAALRAHGLIAT